MWNFDSEISSYYKIQIPGNQITCLPNTGFSIVNVYRESGRLGRDFVSLMILRIAPGVVLYTEVDVKMSSDQSY